LIAGFAAAVALLAPGAAYAAEFWKAPPLFLKGAVFVAIFFVVYFVFSLIGWLLHRSERLLFLKTVNRAGGIAVGLGKGAALIALAVFFLSEAAWLPKRSQEVFHDDQPGKDRRDPRPRFDRRSDLGLRDFEKGRAQPSRPLPLSRRENSVLHRERRQGHLSLLRLPRRRQRLQFFDAVRSAELPRGGGAGGPALRHRHRTQRVARQKRRRR